MAVVAFSRGNIHPIIPSLDRSLITEIYYYIYPILASPGSILLSDMYVMLTGVSVLRSFRP